LLESRLRKIVERVPDGHEPIMKGPETVLFDNNGIMYVMTEDGKLVSLTDFEEGSPVDSVAVSTAKATVVMYLGNGRPLGGRFSKDGILYIADTLLGLTRVRFRATGVPIVEVVASHVDMNAKTRPLLYTNDVAIGPKTGNIYFTDSTDVIPDRIGSHSWDTLHASKIDFLRGARNGRLLRYDPITEELDVLAEGIWFANGVAVDKQETFVMISETWSSRVLQYHILNKKTDKVGTVEVMADKFPGFPDGAECSHTSGNCYAPLPSSEPTLMRKVRNMPNYLDLIPRAIFMMLPKWATPKPVKYGGIVEISYDGTERGQRYAQRVIQDPEGEVFSMITGVTEHEGKLYLGSLKNEYIGVYDLQQE